MQLNPLVPFLTPGDGSRFPREPKKSFAAARQPVGPKTRLVLICLGAALAVGPGCHRETLQDYMAAGEKAARENRFDVAVQSYTQAIKLQPKSAEAHLALAALFSRQRQWNQAEEQYRAAVALDPANAGTRLALASVLQSSNKAAEAERELRTAIGLDPHNAPARFALATLLDHEGGHEAEAAAEYGQASAIDPRLARPGPVASATSAEATPAASGATKPAVAGVKIRPLDRTFLLTHNSPVYEGPDRTARTVGQVHKRKYVHVVGIAGEWIEIKLKNGTVGFIPSKAAE